MRIQWLGSLALTLAVSASAAVSEREMMSRSELLCSNADVTIGLNATKGWLFHKDANKEDGWEASVERFERLTHCSQCYKVQGTLPVPHPEVPFPLPLSVWAETKPGVAGKGMAMSYAFGMGKPEAKIEGLTCKRGGW